MNIICLDITFADHVFLSLKGCTIKFFPKFIPKLQPKSDLPIRSTGGFKSKVFRQNEVVKQICQLVTFPGVYAYN